MKRRRLSISGPEVTRGRRESPMVQAAMAVVLVASTLLLGEWTGSVIRESASEIRILSAFVAILICSAFGGVIAGAIATALACGLNLWLRRHGGPTHGLRSAWVELLLAEGTMVSLVGWSLQRGRFQARVTDARIRTLQKQVLEIGDEERRRIGQDLHDGLGQHLTGISLLSESLAQHAVAGVPPKLEEVERITQLSSDAVRQARELARSLAPLTLEQEGFVAAMEELAQNAAVLLGIECEWNCQEEELPLDHNRAVHLYRIVQEAINNSVKHGKARRVTVTASTRGKELTLVVGDDGSGLSQKTIDNPGLGLRIMEYRARMTGAELTAERVSPSGGTVVRCTCRMDESN